MLMLCLCRSANASEISISISVRWSPSSAILIVVSCRKLVSKNFGNTAPAYAHMLMFWYSHLLLNFAYACAYALLKTSLNLRSYVQARHRPSHVPLQPIVQTHVPNTYRLEILVSSKELIRQRSKLLFRFHFFAVLTLLHSMETARYSCQT